MSSITTANAASNALPTVNFRPHGRGHGKKGTDMESQSESVIGSPGQMPVGASQPLLSSMLQSLQQAVGSQATATGSATGTIAAIGTTVPTGTSASTTGAGAPIAASPAVAQDLSGFMHSLFQVLQPGGSAGGAGTTAAPASAAAAPSTGGAGQYQGSLASSLQTLIQQVGSTGAATPAISNLESSFNTLMQRVGGGMASTAAAGGATSPSSTASLQSVLSNMLQNLQTNGLQMPNLSGSRVNARV